MADIEKISLGEAAGRYLAKLPPEKSEVSQPEVYKFVRFYGSERPMAGLAAHEVEKYAEQASLTDRDYLKKLDIARAFLACARKEGWTRANLGVHLKTKKTRAVLAAKASAAEAIPLTEEGYAGLKTELESLKEQRPHLIEEMRRAAADKDFRENAPLHAAREKRGHLEGRIMQLEETLKVAVIIDQEGKSTLKASVGDTVVLVDLASGEELRYRLVSTREVDPAQGKISSASPIGKALLGRGEGETVEITVPAGKLRYQLKRVEH